MDDRDYTTEITQVSNQTHQIDAAIEIWLNAKYGRSQSKGTMQKYRAIIENFRTTIQAAGYDLDADRQVIRIAAQGWAEQPWTKELAEQGVKVGNATYNMRITALSSFFTYAIDNDFLQTTRNPLSGMKQRHVELYQGAQPMTSDEVTLRLEKIDRSTPAGERDYVLLSLGFSTGRRVGELAGLRTGDFTFIGTTRMRVFWRRCKGGKSHTDTIEERDIIDLLRNHLCKIYGSIEHAKKQTDRAVWPSYSNNHHGQPISTSAIANICLKYLGTYETHTMRHTFTDVMKDEGATDEEVGEALLHVSTEATKHYIRKVQGQKNPIIGKVIRRFGIKAREPGSTL